MIDIDKKYQTRDGRAVRLISNNGTREHPIVGVIEGRPRVSSWSATGSLLTFGRHNYDLVLVPEKIRVAIWIDKNRNVYNSARGDIVPQHATIVELEVPT